MKTGRGNAKLSRKIGLSIFLMLLFLSFAISGCGGADQPSAVTGENPVAASGDVTLVVGAYSVAKDALQDIILSVQSGMESENRPERRIPRIV